MSTYTKIPVVQLETDRSTKEIHGTLT